MSGVSQRFPASSTVTPRDVHCTITSTSTCARPLFQDVRLRRALAYALDRKTIIAKCRTARRSDADADESPIIGHAYDPNVAHYPYDPAKARAMLDAMGWKVGPDGIRVRNGQRLSFTLSTQTESTHGHAIQALDPTVLARRRGRSRSSRTIPTSLFFDNTANGILQGGHYDVATFALGGAADPDDSAIYSGRQLRAARTERAVLERTAQRPRL